MQAGRVTVAAAAAWPRGYSHLSPLQIAFHQGPGVAEGQSVWTMWSYCPRNKEAWDHHLVREAHGVWVREDEMPVAGSFAPCPTCTPTPPSLPPGQQEPLGLRGFLSRKEAREVG